MQGQSPPVQVKDPYTGSILMHVRSSCKHTGVYNVHLPRIIRNLLMGVTGKQKQNKFGRGSDFKSTDPGFDSRNIELFSLFPLMSMLTG